VVTAGLAQLTCLRQSPVQLGGTPQTLAFPAPPHVSGWLHAPHWSSPPHPSLTGPHAFTPHVAGVHAGDPQTLETPPPPHVCGAVQAPHWSSPPQPSATGPQLTAWPAQVFGVQTGYSYASTVNPNTDADSSVLLVFAQLMSGMFFFALGLDREVLRVFAASLRLYPPGTFLLKASAAAAVIDLGANMLSTGVRMALPVVALLTLVDIALALLGRMHQQLQLLSLAFPVKMLTTLAFLAALAALFLPVYRGAAERTMAALFRLF